MDRLDDERTTGWPLYLGMFAEDPTTVWLCPVVRVVAFSTVRRLPAFLLTPTLSRIAWCLVALFVVSVSAAAQSGPGPRLRFVPGEHSTRL